MSAKDSKWFYFPTTNPDSKWAVIAFPYFGAGASTVAPWGGTFAKRGFDFYPVQYPQRESRAMDENSESIRTMAKEIADSAEDLFKEKRIVFYGRCYGLIPAFEVAKYIAAKWDIRPELFVTSAGLVPEKENIFLGYDPDLDEEAFKQLLMEKNFMTDYQMANPDFVRFFMPGMRSDYRMMAGYALDEEKYQLACPVLSLIGTEEEELTLDMLRWWEEYTDKAVYAETIEGGHFFETLENIDVVAARIEELVKMNA